MQRLLESRLLQGGEDKTRGQIVHFEGTSRKGSKMDTEGDVHLAQKIVAKEAKKLLRSADFNGVFGLLEDKNLEIEHEVLIDVLLAALKMLSSEISEPSEGSEKTFNEVEDQKYREISQRLLKTFEVKGKSKKGYCRSIVAVVCNLLYRVEIGAGRPSEAVKKLDLPTSLELSKLLIELFNATSCRDVTDEHLQQASLQTASHILNRIGLDASEHASAKEQLEEFMESIENVAANLQEISECAALIDMVVNGSRQNDRNKPVCHYKMRF